MVQVEKGDRATSLSKRAPKLNPKQQLNEDILVNSFIFEHAKFKFTI